MTGMYMYVYVLDPPDQTKKSIQGSSGSSQPICLLSRAGFAGGKDAQGWIEGID